ncbi:MAG: hypothetical protein ACPG77_20270 [Nannocystaceae bacterium]
MRKTSILLMAALLATATTACDDKSADKPKEADKTAKAEVKPEVKPAEKPAAEKTDDRVLADSGLGIGGKFKAFNIVNCDSGDEYCQVCKFGGNPKIMAVGSIDDPDFKNDIQNIDALVKKYGEDKVKAFAVITDIKDGKATTPIANKDELQAKAKALRTELNVSIPVVIPAAEGDQQNAAFADYNITKSRTVMFADGKNAVKYSAVAPSDLAALHTAVEGVLGGAAPAAAAAEKPAKTG